MYEKHVSMSNCAKNEMFKCQFCGKGFAGQSYLDCHQQIHSEVKKFKCMICQKCFHQKGNLKTHEKKIHSEIKQ